MLNSGQGSILWDYKQNIQNLNEFPVALENGIQKLFVPLCDFYLSKDGKYCAVSPQKTQLILICNLPQWTVFQNIEFKETKYIDNCYFSVDYQFLLLEKIKLGNYFYYIHDINQNRGKQFPWIIQGTQKIKFWTTRKNYLNLLFTKNDKFFLYQMDKDFKFSLIKQIFQPFRQDSINRMQLLEGSTCNNIYQNFLKQYPANTNTNNFDHSNLHMNQYLFITRFDKEQKTLMKHLVCGKIIRIIEEYYYCVKVFIQNLFVWKELDSLQFYDFTRGKVVYTVNYSQNSNFNGSRIIEMIIILGDHLVLRTQNGNYIGWKIK